MKRRSGYLMVNQIPCLSDKKTKTRQGKVEANQHRDQGTYYIHIAHPQTHTDKRNLTAALSETAEGLKKRDRMIFFDKPPWMPIGLLLPLALWRLGKQLTHTYVEWRPISTRVFSPSRWIADALLARALPWAFCSGLFVASRDLSVCDLLPALGLHGDESGPHPFFLCVL